MRNLASSFVSSTSLLKRLFGLVYNTVFKETEANVVLNFS
jgi:hypothetical protein